MRVDNIANKKGDRTYEISIIGTEQELEGFMSFTSHPQDFLEEENETEFSLTIMGSWEMNKKEFVESVRHELKEFKKLLKK